MENTSDFKKNKPQTQENPKKTRVSGGKLPLSAAADIDDKKARELPSGDATVPAAERGEKGNITTGDGQKAAGKTTTRKRARETDEGSSGKIENQQGGHRPVVEEPPCPLWGSGSVLNGTNTTCMHVSVNLTRSVPRGASSSSPSTPLVSTEEKEAVGKPSADARKDGVADFDLNVTPFLIPDLNQYPPEY